MSASKTMEGRLYQHSDVSHHLLKICPEGWWVDEEAKLTVSEALGGAVGRQPRFIG